MNPYLHLHKKAVALLKQEASLSEDERRANQWSLLVKFCNTQVLVGKGDVNTIFYQFGPEGKRNVAYPDDFLARLKALAEQKACLVKVRVDGKVKTLFSLQRALALDASKGGRIVGVDFHMQEKILFVAKPTLDGSYKWAPPRSTSKGGRRG